MVEEAMIMNGGMENGAVESRIRRRI